METNLCDIGTTATVISSYIITVPTIQNMIHYRLWGLMSALLAKLLMNLYGFEGAEWHSELFNAC